LAVLSTGPIDNDFVKGASEQVIVKLVNRSSVQSAMVLIQGYYLNGSRNLYVLEQVTLAPNAAITKTYFADFDGYEFVFTTSGPAEASTEISVWGINANGQIVSSQRVVADEELNS
jgi:hypothetical protein